MTIARLKAKLGGIVKSVIGNTNTKRISTFKAISTEPAHNLIKATASVDEKASLLHNVTAITKAVLAQKEKARADFREKISNYFWRYDLISEDSENSEKIFDAIVDIAEKYNFELDESDFRPLYELLVVVDEYRLPFDVEEIFFDSDFEYLPGIENPYDLACRVLYRNLKCNDDIFYIFENTLDFEEFGNGYARMNGIYFGEFGAIQF